ncbi:Putative heavy-metal chelation domain protein [Acididesulfobacillus acetoxydans]|uniref:Heavy-metal chelation domain protein n=2 Tax=Acididesulfobacillus acetoxydans TaxID=1561005 RepID=A0A8S0Y4U8_9FIRM|nr:Putative heavy-metal chelation domain protein [Acididesulfobacillus acetoxydans]CEJ07234.1 PF04016 domain protein [Acididesulfobacillus acetoxydans]
MPLSGQLKGKKVLDFIEEMFMGKVLKKALGIAVLNALSATCWQLRPPLDYVIKNGVDAFETLTLPEEGYTVIVGALTPIIKRVKKGKNKFCILEMDPVTLKADELPFYKATDRAPEVLPTADLVVITGTTLINDTLEDLLKLTKPEADIVVVGPTASMLPEAFFQRGVNLLGGTVVTRPDGLLDILAEAGSGYHFYGEFGERVVIQKRKGS